MIQLGGTHVVRLINLLAERMLDSPAIHCDETPLQELHSDTSPNSDHHMWVRAAGPPGRKIILCDYDASRSGCDTPVAWRTPADDLMKRIKRSPLTPSAMPKSHAILSASCIASSAFMRGLRRSRRKFCHKACSAERFTTRSLSGPN